MNYRERRVLSRGKELLRKAVAKSLTLKDPQSTEIVRQTIWWSAQFIEALITPHSHPQSCSLSASRYLHAMEIWLHQLAANSAHVPSLQDICQSEAFISGKDALSMLCEVE